MCIHDFLNILEKDGKELISVIKGDASFCFYLIRNFGFLLKQSTFLRDVIEKHTPYGSIVKYKGVMFHCNYITDFDVFFQGSTVPECEHGYSIPECHIEEGDIVFDCGSYIGIFSYFASKKASTIFAFEPMPKSYLILTKNIAMWGVKNKVIPINIGIYSEDTIKDFLFNPVAPEVASLLDTNSKNIKEIHRASKNSLEFPHQEIIKTKLTKIDSFVKNENLNRVNFIKMDIEGSEIEAIKGAKDVIKKFKPRMAICAYHHPEDRKIIPEMYCQSEMIIVITLS